MTLVRAALLALGLIVCADPARAQTITTQVVDVGSGASAVRYLLLTPSPSGIPAPPSAVMLFAGGNGRLGLTPQGAITTGLSGNFLVRTREQFAQANLFVAVVDAPGGVGVTEATRLSPEYAAIMTDVIGDLRSRTNTPKIWMVGTSSGSLSAASIAGIYYQQTITPPIFPRPVPNAKRPNGVVLTSSQTDLGTTGTTTCHATVFDKPRKLPSINVPAYVVGDRSDACPCTPPKRVSAIIDALTSAPAKLAQLFPLDGFPSPPAAPNTDACSGFTPHGFYGIEASVVTAIANWVKSH